MFYYCICTFLCPVLQAVTVLVAMAGIKKCLAMRLKLQGKSPIWWPVFSYYVPSSFQEMTKILEDAFF